MKLGVFFIGSPRSGGLYQYSLCILDSLKERGHRVIIFNLSGADFPRDRYKGCFKISRCLRFVSWLKQASVNACLKVRLKNIPREQPGINGKAPLRQEAPAGRAARLAGWLETLCLRLLVKLNRVDLLVFTAPNQLCFKLGTPYIMPVHDLQHRLNPQFPEVSADGIWENREYLYANAIPGAGAVLVDSETGKEDVLSYYPVDEEKIEVLPFTPPTYLCRDYTEGELSAARKKYHLPERFLFYPSNFWAHKNHELIIQALNHIKTGHGPGIPVVFVGSARGRYSHYAKVRELTRAYGLEDLVHYLGYVSNDEMGCLYRLAEALVMPTFFGPTNIPYLEAFALGCPVIGSDIRGVREQIGNAGLLVDPGSSPDLATAILRIWNDAELRKELTRKGYAKIEAWDFEKFSATLNRIIDKRGERLAAGGQMPAD